MRTLVIQSKGPFATAPWLSDATATVKHWASTIPADYSMFGDDVFRLLPADLREKWRGQTRVLIDLARLYLIQQALEEGYERVIWADADLVVLNPLAANLPFDGHRLARRVWVERTEKGALKISTLVDNAFMVFCRGDSLLEFYLDTAGRLMRSNIAPSASHFIGSNFLSALQPMARLSVEEGVASLSPLALVDLAAGGGEHLIKTRMGHAEKIWALNLGASNLDQTIDGVWVDDALMQQAIKALDGVDSLEGFKAS